MGVHFIVLPVLGLSGHNAAVISSFVCPLTSTFLGTSNQCCNSERSDLEYLGIQPRLCGGKESPILTDAVMAPNLPL